MKPSVTLRVVAFSWACIALLGVRTHRIGVNPHPNLSLFQGRITPISAPFTVSFRKGVGRPVDPPPMPTRSELQKRTKGKTGGGVAGRRGGFTTDATWYGKRGDRWSKRYPAAWWHGWPYRVGEFAHQCACNGVPLFTLVRVVTATGLSIVLTVTDRIGTDVPPDERTRIDLTYAAFKELAHPTKGIIRGVKVEIVRWGKGDTVSWQLSKSF